MAILLKPEPQNIIVRMPNWIGDLVMSTPVLADLRASYPDATITAMVQGNLSHLLQEDPNIDEIFAFSKPSGWLRRTEHRDLIQKLRTGDYDLGVLLTNSFSSAWWFWRGRVKLRLGYAGDWRSLILTHAIPYPENIEKQHLVHTYKQLLNAVGLPETGTVPKLYVSDLERQAASEQLELLGIPNASRIVGVNPGAAYGSAKCWLPERFKEVVHRLLDDPDIYVLFFGDKLGAPLVNDICNDMPSRVINLAGRTSIRELMAYIEACDVFLTNDSGPMHMASALGTPLLALFGSTSDVKTGPFNQGRVIHKHVECSPCYKRECPIDFRCMTRIESEQVYNELKSILDRASN